MVHAIPFVKLKYGLSFEVMQFFFSFESVPLIWIYFAVVHSPTTLNFIVLFKTRFPPRSLNFRRLLWVAFTPSVAEGVKTIQSNHLKFRLSTWVVCVNSKHHWSSLQLALQASATFFSSRWLFSPTFQL